MNNQHKEKNDKIGSQPSPKTWGNDDDHPDNIKGADNADNPDNISRGAHPDNSDQTNPQKKKEKENDGDREKDN